MEKTKEGFTLLELLVVVLIIGILAAIALPQYQMAVGKAKFATLKNLTKSIQQSAQRYYLINNAYPRSSDDLDIDIGVVSSRDASYGTELTLGDGITCGLWKDSLDYVTCGREIFGRQVLFYIERQSGISLLCLVQFGEPSDISTKICANETNKSIKPSNCDALACRFNY